jgi:hypothetical protein
MPCLVGCITKYACGGIISPVDGQSLAPWVRVQFASVNGHLVTVGNQSSPGVGNTAVIKGFQYGMSQKGGTGCTIEIFDEQGSSFERFMDRLNKNVEKDPQGVYTMVIQWGWTGAECGSGPGPGSLPVSAKNYFTIQNITAAYENGKIKFTIQGLDDMQRIFESRNEEVKGNDKQKLPLKEAIRRLFQNNKPPVNSVRFLRVTEGGTQEWGFKASEGGFEGPQSVWEGDQQNALATARKWLAPFTTDRNKGVVAAWNSADNPPELIFWEDTLPGCNEGVQPCPRSIGTYIVNGGKCSSVISFNPSVQWNPQYVGKAGGNTGGPGSAGGAKMDGFQDCKTFGTGTQTSLPPSRYAWDVHGPENMTEKSKEAAAAHERAGMTYHSITAEMRVQGDPTLSRPVEIVGKTVAIVVINPYHLVAAGGSDLAWLADPECNSVFSNKGWLIEGVSHDIREGSYVTTIKVALSAPGVEINAGQPVGGTGSGGWTPAN